MPKTLSIVWIHVIWSTKNREPLLVKSIRYDLFNYLKSYSEQNGILLDTVNGVEDHVHLLLRLKPIQSISEVMNSLKGASSRWVNLVGEFEGQFKWQNGYGVFSVGEEHIKKVRSYIYDQEMHHKSEDYRSEIMRISKSSSLP